MVAPDRGQVDNDAPGFVTCDQRLHDDAIARANRSVFGLGSVLFSNEESEIDQAVRELEAGATFINSMVASDPRLPFGGIKESGYGRELAADGLRAFMNRKTVSIA